VSPRLRYHFSGIAGAGTDPLARLLRAWGHDVQGSDRAFDQGKSAEVAEGLRRAGVRLTPHDGSAIVPDLDRVVHSTAVESETPELVAARALGLPLVPRPALLAELLAAAAPGVAVAGTSGKSTIVALVGWLLREAGVPASVLGGAGLVGEDATLCVVGPAGGPLVAEACESDESLTGYRAALGLIHNVSRDHAELPVLRARFAAFARGLGRVLVNAACPEAAAIGRAVGARTYGRDAEADARAVLVDAGPASTHGRLEVDGRALRLDVPLPGRHNFDNAVAAVLVALELGVPAPTIEALLPRFPGVRRRFELVGTTASGIRVVDDYAHNAAKLEAALTTAQVSAPRVLACFQPHGYGPARALRPELRALLPRLLRPADRFCYLEIYYAGGTTTRDLSSRALAEDLAGLLPCGYAEDHAAAVRWVVRHAQPGDTVLIMGARDPDLPHLARAVLRALDRQPVAV